MVVLAGGCQGTLLYFAAVLRLPRQQRRLARCSWADLPLFRPDISPVGADRASVMRCRWSLLLLSPLLSTRRKPLVAISPAACRGWPASGAGRLRPGPWFLTGVSAEAPGSSMTSHVRSPGTFCCARCPAVTVMLEAGGADTYTPQAIPGSGPGPFSLHLFRHRRRRSRRLAPARSADALNAALPRKALAAQAGRGVKHRGRPEPLGAGVRGRQPPGREAFEFGPDLPLRRSVCAAGQPARSQVSRCIRLSGSDRDFPALTRRSGTQRARGGYAHGSGGRLSNLANLCLLPAGTRSLVSEEVRIIPCVFRIMAVRGRRLPAFQAGHMGSLRVVRTVTGASRLASGAARSSMGMNGHL
jgi:hypothetical protein